MAVTEFTHWLVDERTDCVPYFKRKILVQENMFKTPNSWH